MFAQISIILLIVAQVALGRYYVPYSLDYGFDRFSGSSANAVGGGNTVLGSLRSDNVAFTNSNPWSTSGFASDSTSGSGYGLNLFGAASSRSNSGGYLTPVVYSHPYRALF